MFKRHKIGLLMGLVCLLFASSCKDEPLNAECDIEQVILHTNHVDEVFFNKTDSAKSLLYTDNEAVFNVRRNAPMASRLNLKSPKVPPFSALPRATTFRLMCL